MKWADVLSRYDADGSPLFGGAYLACHGDLEWDPCQADSEAAGALHVQLVSRVATQPLGYSEGDERAALGSIHQLFSQTRAIATAHHGANHFDGIVWHVLNGHVRPFTAKWHRRSEQGALDALDASDIFRSELVRLRRTLLLLDDLMLLLRDGTPRRPVGEKARGSIDVELATALPFGILEVRGPVDPADAARMNRAEADAIRTRRGYYGLPSDHDAAGLAISGGGIRSATFALGVLVALARRNLMPHFDYMSTVSGGGFVGAFITAYLSAARSDAGMRSVQLPFRPEGGEATALRHIRHRSKYLQTSSWERAQFVAAHLYGVILNATALSLAGAAAALVDLGLRSLPAFSGTLLAGMALTLAAVGILLPGVTRVFPAMRRWADVALALPSTGVAVLLAWKSLGSLHEAAPRVKDAAIVTWWALPGLAASLAVVSAVLLNNPVGRRRWVRACLATAAALTVPLVLLLEELSVYLWLCHGAPPSDGVGWGRPLALTLLLAGLLATVYVTFDVNFTSPHRFYKRKLAEAYLIRPATDGESVVEPDVTRRLSAATADGRGPYHLINAALNVPNSADPAMQGRLTDFFLFSPAFVGSPLTGYLPTTDWERVDPNLDLGTAMAISGAAASPLMGPSTKGYVSFWLTLLNVRLGYWVRRPQPVPGRFGDAPGVDLLLREAMGLVDERARYLNVTDGGHVENLGVYELLRRRCKYVVAIDGEHDPAMTFHGLANLQRMAAIDLGTHIDVDATDLRLDAIGRSRSHFLVCRIRYPNERGGTDLGYLIYVKLSLTGNEGEFLRRYKLDEPDFPHHPTANQSFSEAQFEAYRALGEHVGENLFLEAIVGPLAHASAIALPEWFAATARSMLQVFNR